MRRRNNEFLKKVRENKPTANSAQTELSRNPMAKWMVGMLCFVVIGGVFFELARLIFL
ncbi:hypothetical protein M407DRAFT_246909 [Tulasnella calospora MUT 4182]|uniref:Stress-associated endoplasmic reticulum protein n=1 Tax=Tulasnella calospora MUT 4182 TaxID=1051891 RepID=A0A0C3Q275_9AGAM|nr:hypothetical protein M407DRAFT_246909 [Tulasnella calospora MUT 4182]